MNAISNLRDFDSFYALIEYFDTEEKCIDYLAKLRWNGNPVCPHCGHDHAYELNLKGRPKYWKCAGCRKKFSVRVGTIFEESKISLRKWFFAIYLITAHKKGISSHQLARDLKFTQKTAWFVLQRILLLLKLKNSPNPLKLMKLTLEAKRKINMLQRKRG